jgi:hypothetical protein
MRHSRILLRVLSDAVEDYWTAAIPFTPALTSGNESVVGTVAQQLYTSASSG